MFQVTVELAGNQAGGKGKTSERPVDGNAEEEAPNLNIPVLSGNPLVEILYGTVHLFRPEKQLESLKTVESVISRKNTDSPLKEQNSIDFVGNPKQHQTWICVLAVPSYMELSDFYAFLSGHRNRISHIRVVRDARVSRRRYMVLLEFRTSQFAKEFYDEYNGKPFCSFDTTLSDGGSDKGFGLNQKTDLISLSDVEVCRLFFISGIEFNKGEGKQESTPASNEKDKDTKARETEYKHGERLMKRPTIAKRSGYTEVPTCPVCLERLDPSASGMMTTVCNHTFHCHCLTKWQREDSSCPVCRYCHAANQGDDEDADTLTSCEVCNSKQSLWICMICGVVGCGRYSSGHAHEHFQESGHAYALELETQRVWDYAGDGYVHRLIRNKVDGKLVELPDPHNNNSYERSQVPPDTNASQAREFQEKNEQLYIEYNELLCSQLDSQRHYFESRMEEIRRENESKMKSLLKKSREVQTKAEKYEKEYHFVKQVNDSLIKNQRELRTKVTDLETERDALLKTAKVAMESKERVMELEEQVRDLMFFLDAKNKVESSPLCNEIKEGSIGVLSASSSDLNTSTSDVGARKNNLSSTKKKKKKSSKKR